MTDDHTAIKPNKELEEKEALEVMQKLGIDDPYQAINKLYDMWVKLEIEQ